jgi:hypothetical protein
MKNTPNRQSPPAFMPIPAHHPHHHESSPSIMNKPNPYATAASRTRKAEAEVSQLKELLSAAEQQAQAHASLVASSQDQASQRKFEDVSAAHVLGEVSDAELQAARVANDKAQAKAAQEAAGLRSARAAGTAALAGIKRRLAQAEAELETATELEREGLIDWAAAELERADKHYVNTANACVEAMLRVQAVRQWLDSQGELTQSPHKPFSVSMGLPPLAKVSHDAAMAMHPAAAGVGHAWSENLVPHFDPRAVYAVLVEEIDNMTGANDAEQAEAGPLESVAQKFAAAARRLASSMTGKDAPSQGAGV